MKSEKHSSTSLGITTLITFFTVLILVSFALLVTTTARNDSKLSDRAATSVTEYYAADCIAEEKLMQLHNLLKETPQESLLTTLEENAFSLVRETINGELVIEYIVPINDIKNLEVQILANLNQLDGLDRLSWQTVII